MVPASPSAARGWSWRSARAARPRGCGRRRPACRTAPAASRRLRGRAAPRRCGRSSPSRARRGRCRHRPRVRAASRPPPDRGCSSACAAALRSASSWRVSSVPRGARMMRALSIRVMWSSFSVPSVVSVRASTSDRQAPLERRRCGAWPRSDGCSRCPGARQRAIHRSSVSARTRRADRAAAHGLAAARSTRSGAWKSQPCAAASSSMPTTCAAFSAMRSRRRAPCAAIDTWSSWLAEVGIESTLAG